MSEFTYRDFWVTLTRAYCNTPVRINAGHLVAYFAETARDWSRRHYSAAIVARPDFIGEEYAGDTVGTTLVFSGGVSQWVRESEEDIRLMLEGANSERQTSKETAQTDIRKRDVSKT
jgi:hypothetical protein